MVVLHRAVQAEDKAVRRTAILAAAQALLARDPENFASVAEVARAAGLAKGTVYLYFRTKEEIVLGVHAQHAEAMFAALDATLAAHPGKLRPENVADAICAFVTSTPLFLHLSAACMSRFQRTIDARAMLAFRAAIAARLAHFGPILEARMPSLAPGQGVALLQGTYAYAVGMWQLFEPTQRVAGEVESNPELAVFDRDFRQVLYAGLLALWNGFLATGSRSV